MSTVVIRYYIRICFRDIYTAYATLRGFFMRRTCSSVYFFFNKIKYELWSKWGMAIWAILSSLEPLCSNVSSLEEQTFLQFLKFALQKPAYLGIFKSQCSSWQMQLSISNSLRDISWSWSNRSHSSHYTPLLYPWWNNIE